MWRVALGAALFWLTAESAYAAGCSYSPYRRTAGQQAQSFMEADSGKPCAIGKYFWTTGNATIGDGVILSRPSHGSVSREGPYAVIYRSQSGFRGEDKFSFGVVSKGRNKSSTATILVMVAVK